jgi:hypothetical protein
MRALGLPLETASMPLVPSFCDRVPVAQALDATSSLEMDYAALTFARQEAVRRAFVHAWRGYATAAFGLDVLKPLSGSGEGELCKMGLTLIDALDTILLMGLPGPYAEARRWVCSSVKCCYNVAYTRPFCRSVAICG